MSDEHRVDPDEEAIRLRRRRFIQVALAGIAVASGCDEVLPGPCLSPPMACLQVPVQTCLSIAVVEPPDAGSTDAAEPEEPRHPLEVDEEEPVRPADPE